jgi:hypothetical protein
MTNLINYTLLGVQDESSRLEIDGSLLLIFWLEEACMT